MDGCLTDHTLGEGGSFERGQTQVPDLHAARGPRDEDVVTLQVPVDDGRSACVQEVQAFEDLTTPAAQHFGFHHLEALQIPGGNRKHYWCGTSCVCDSGDSRTLRLSHDFRRPTLYEVSAPSSYLIKDQDLIALRC